MSCNLTAIGLEIQKVTIIHISTRNKPDELYFLKQECKYFTHFLKKC